MKRPVVAARIFLTLTLLLSVAACAPTHAHAGGWSHRYERVIAGPEMLIIDRATGRVVERRWIAPPPPPVVVVRPPVYLEPPPWERPHHHHRRDRW